MKLNYSQLESQISKKLSPVYMISGDDIILKQDAIQLIRKTAKQAGFTERVRITPDAGFDWEQLYSLLYSGSLLAEKRLIELDFRDITPNKSASSILQAYSEAPAEDALVIIDLSKADAKITKSAWYQALDKMGITVAIWPIPREQLPAWLIQRAKKYKLTLTLPAANLLADYVEGNLTAAVQALEKIYLLQPQQPIDAELIPSLLQNESRFTIFDLTEHLIAGDKARTLQTLSTLQSDGIEPSLILWGITRELRLMAELIQQHQQGQPYDALFQKHKIFARRQSTVRRFLSRFSLKDCQEYLKQAANLDQMIKGAIPYNPWEGLQLFCLRVV